MINEKTLRQKSRNSVSLGTSPPMSGVNVSVNFSNKLQLAVFKTMHNIF
jgi:hypothetical protein